MELNRITILIIVVLLIGIAVVALAEDGIVCEQPYALCADARCIPDPQDPLNKTICECIVSDGMSIGFTSCEDRTPKEVGGTMTLRSTYSFVELNNNPTMICPGGTPWSDCFDQPCTVDPMNPLKAICSCVVQSSSVKWVTQGGNCNTKSCANGFWSGASVANDLANRETLAAAMNLPISPMGFACVASQAP